MLDDVTNVINILKKIDWDFKTLNKNEQDLNYRKLHWYPATFTRKIPEVLIDLLSKEGDLVYDPFGGIGTTFFEALYQHRKPYTSDISAISLKFMNNMMLLFETVYDIEKLIKKTYEIYYNYNHNINYSHDFTNTLNYNELCFWYDEITLNKLYYLKSITNGTQDIYLRALLEINISAMAKSVTIQKRGWGYIADNVKPNQGISKVDVLKKFVTDSFKILTHAKIVRKKTQDIDIRSLSCNIYKHDVRNKIEFLNNEVDLIVTSPPYPNMIDYIKSQRLSYLFFDLDFSEELNMEIGARARRNTTDSTIRYYEDMIKTNSNIIETLKPSGIMCVILPDYNNSNTLNAKRSLLIDDYIKDIESRKMNKVITLERKISDNLRSFNTKISSLKNELIVVFRKEE